MKNVILDRTIIKGHKSYKLINPDGSENLGFAVYRDQLIQKRRGKASNTIDAYLRAVALFFDYLFEVALTNNKEILTEDLIFDAIDLWDDYLVEGENSEDIFVTRVCQGLPSPKVSASSSVIYHAGLKDFLTASERLRKSITRLQHKGLIDKDPLQSDTALVTIPKARSIPLNQRKAMITNSMLAGVIRHGPQMATPAMFPQISPGSDARDIKAFPCNLIVPLIETMPNNRDKALYALMAASGCRIHEALRVLTSDIDVAERSVNLADPATRINDGYYDSFSTAERKIINTWKGREIQVTFLIEPFKSLFFKYAAKYFEEDKPHDTAHDFFFCCTTYSEWGKPFLFSSPSNIRYGYNQAKHTVIRKPIKRLGPHSLRHNYGFYLKNFCPRLDGGFGLNLEIVQTLMGHKDIKSTQKYAKTDEQRAALEIAYANSLVYDINNPKSIDELRRDMLLKELDRVQNAITEERLLELKDV